MIFLGICSVILSLALFLNNIAAATILMIIGLTLLTGFYGVQINTKAARYREFYSMFGIKKGTWHHYKSIEEIFINSTLETETVYSSSNRKASVKSRKYVSFIKFDSGQKIRFYEDERLSSLVKKLTKPSRQLKVKVSDSNN